MPNSMERLAEAPKENVDFTIKFRVVQIVTRHLLDVSQ